MNDKPVTPEQLAKLIGVALGSTPNTQLEPENNVINFNDYKKKQD